MYFEHIGKIILYHFSVDHGEAGGYFDPDTPDNIYVNDRTGPIQREVTYFHELGHKICHENKCWCWKQGTDFWCEYHAMKYELERVIERNDKRVTLLYVKLMEKFMKKYKDNPKRYPSHMAAMKRIMKMKAYKELWIGLRV